MRQLGVGPARAARALVLLYLCVPAWVLHAASPRSFVRALPAGGEPQARSIVERALRAHGGIESWIGKGDASFTTTWTHYDRAGKGVSARYLIRFPVEDSGGAVTAESIQQGEPVRMGFAGNLAWFRVGSTPHDDPGTLEAGRMFLRRARSLMSLPFRLEDPGTTFRYEGSTVRAGMKVDKVRALRDGEHAGTYLFDRETGRLAGIAPDPDAEGGTLAEYQAFEMHEGILIPARQVFKHVDPETGAPRRVLSITVDDVTFGHGPPEDLPGFLPTP